MTVTFPDWIEPMAATLTHERFTDSGWIFERKFDGIRLLAFRNGAGVRLLSRNRLEQNLPAIAASIAALPLHDVVLDGEVTWNDRGTTYHVFDLMWLNGRAVTSEPLEARLALLRHLPLPEPLVHVAQLTDPKPWEHAWREGWEGIIAKRLGSIYEHRRSPHWLKMKCEVTHALVVGGFTDPRGSRVGLGALLVGYFEGDEFVFAGRVGTGLDRALLLELRTRLNAIAISAPPFTKAVGLPRVGANWVRPEIVVQVAFTEWTPHGKLRHPRLLGVRADQSPREVVREGA